MSSLPREVLEDVLLPLDRWTLDNVQFTDRRFLHLIAERMSVVCLRQIAYASFQAPSRYSSPYADATSVIRIDGPPVREISNDGSDTARLFADFTRPLRSSRVAHLTLNGLVFTPELAAHVLQTPVVTGSLSLHDVRCAQLTPTQFQELLLRFSPSSLEIKACQLRAYQLTGDLIRALSENRVRRTKFHNFVPVDSDSFAVTDDALVDLCVRSDAQVGRKGFYAPVDELALHGGRFTKNLFKRLVEASSVSRRTRPLRIIVSPSPVEQKDLRDFAHHLSSRYGLRIYDFPGVEHAGGMHLQIVLQPGNLLQMLRAPRAHYVFYKPDEAIPYY
ncbi:hypothetical protein AAVH_09488 [Aphelenchoides avenae]|nr:hypothetical protein AAVH_09488 [Aphelenchus avenae]